MNTSAVSFLRLSCLLAAWACLQFSDVATFAAEVNLLCFGDWGQNSSTAQRATALRMAVYAAKSDVRFDAALLLGDNFYGKMPRGVSDPRWRTEFEEMYSAQMLPMPFYVALGNHDYEPGKAAAELAYAKQHPDSRWKMPAKWYRVEIPADHPVVSVLVLDSNYADLLGAWKTELTWMESELAKPRPGTWVIATAHHPLFSNGQHGDTKKIIEDWGPLFKEHKLDFFLCGHDHDLQHLELAGWPTSFILAGGGGAKIRPMKADAHGPFSRSLNGFCHLQFTGNEARGKFIAVDGTLVHEFTRSATGAIKVVQTTGRDKAAGKDKGEKD